MEIPNISTQMSKTAWDIYFLLRMKNLEQAVSVNSNLCNLSTFTREAKIWITFHNSHFFSSNPKATLIFKADADLNNLKIFSGCSQPHHPPVPFQGTAQSHRRSSLGSGTAFHSPAVCAAQAGTFWVQP